MSKCFLCGTPIEGEPKIVHAIVPLEKYPEHADPSYVHWYPACPECVKKGELV
jgi:hypothetical protein